MTDEHDRLEAQYDAMKARQKGKEHADAFMQGWTRAKLHTDTLDKAFESWRVCIEPDAPRVDVMLRKLGQIRKLALAAEGHSFDLIIALADEALPQASQDTPSPPEDMGDERALRLSARLRGEASGHAHHGR
jgi:hypothetical protein